MAAVVFHEARVPQIELIYSSQANRLFERMYILVHGLAVSALNRHVQLFVACLLQCLQQIPIRSDGLMVEHRVSIPSECQLGPQQFAPVPDSSGRVSLRLILVQKVAYCYSCIESIACQKAAECSSINGLSFVRWMPRSKTRHWRLCENNGAPRVFSQGMNGVDRGKIEDTEAAQHCKLT